jgi:hypothetical protein
MKSAKSTKIKTILSFLILTFLIFSTFVSAIDVNLEEPNNARKGNDVNFELTINLTEGEKYLFEQDNFIIKYTEFTFTGPNGFEEVCKIQEGELQGCELDISIAESYNSGEITYAIEWDTPTNLKSGNYYVKAKVYSTRPLDYGFNSCSVLQGRYQAWYGFQEDYDPTLDLNEDGVVNLIDISEFASSPSHQNDGILFGRFQGFFRLVGEYQEIAGIDLYQDGIINLSDIVLLSQYLEEGNLELDLNNDGVIDLSDISLISQAYYASKNTSEYEQSLDLNGDGVLNLSDIAILAQKIYEGYEGVQDFNGDGVINLIDISIAAQTMYNTEWCTERLEIMDGYSTIIISEEQGFVIKSSSSGSSGGSDTRNNEVISLNFEGNGETTQIEYTPILEVEPSLRDMWIVTIYLIGIILAISGIVILFKRL